ncbi:MAG: sugar phosphate isomerase/epimerase family protein [bacterium]
MNQSRRAFIRNSSLAAAGATFFNTSLFANAKKGELTGVQLYSIRTDMNADPLGTLQKLAAMGYKHVEHANYINRKFYGWTAKEFKIILDDLGMKMPSGHTVLGAQHWNASKKDFTDAWKYTVEDAATMGQLFVISPSLEADSRKSLSGMMSFMEVFNKSGELCKKSGMKFGYHNHDFEFKEKLGDRTVFDIILTETDPNFVMYQLDIGNMMNAGVKALDIMKKYPGRFQSMHVKDATPVTDKTYGPYESTILGKGIIPIKEVIDLGRKWGTKHFIIEQESYQDKTPLECVKEDLEIMKKWGY